MSRFSILASLSLASLIVLASCTKTPTPTPPTTPPTTPPPASIEATFKKLHLSYFPRMPGLPQELVEAKLIENTSTGCTPDFEACGALWTGDPSDIIAHPATCTPSVAAKAKTVKLPAADVIVAKWRATLAKRGEVIGGDVVEVAQLDLDGDDVADRVYASKLEVKDPPGEPEGYGLQGCGGLLLEMKGNIVPVVENPCADLESFTTSFTQAFRVRNAPGVFLHLHTEMLGATGGMLVHVDNGGVTQVPLPKCSGNG